ncbi:MAG: tetratricopeptide repeat protein, partial [Pseudomonadota bacterium]|nr:tetratricopeptide repeat protein [Pseudomonadota bacterium]
MTEQNIFQEIEADLAHQKYAELWSRFGSYVLAAALTIVLFTAGLTWWQTWHAESNQKATAGLLDIIDQTGMDAGKQMADLEAFAMKDRDRPQAAFAEIAAAGLAAKAGNLDRAVQLYDRIAKNPAIDPVYREFADLMAVRAQLDTGDPQELAKRLEPLVAEGAPWRYSAREFQAYLALRTGDKAKAASLFAALSDDKAAPQSIS